MKHPQHKRSDQPHSHRVSTNVDEPEVRDEVCGMKFPVKQAASRVTIGDQAYYFCSSHCRDKFQEHPDWYVPVS